MYFYYSAPPRVIFTPPSAGGSYEVELGRRFSLGCTLDENIFPVPFQFSSSRLSQRGRYAYDSYSHDSQKVTNVPSASDFFSTWQDVPNANLLL